MSIKISFRKTYSVYASQMHLATMTFPFIKREIKDGAIVETILEKDISENMKQVIRNSCINSKIIKEINKINFHQTDIEKIKKILENMKKILEYNKNINIIVMGTNEFIEKVNELLDLWTKINIKDLENSKSIINVINCYKFENNQELENISQKHGYILKTQGIEEIYNEQFFKKAN